MPGKHSTMVIGGQSVKQAFLIVGALLAGFVGGVLGTRVMRTREQLNSELVVRARSFELVNESGQTISYWGVDKGQNTVLAFGKAGALSGHPGLGLGDPLNQRAAIGFMAGDLPMLVFRGRGGETRMRLYLSVFEKPLLLMEDETGPRVLLGLEQSDTPGPQDNDWSLAFLPERARMGMYTETVGGQTYVRGFSAVQRDRVKYPYQQPK
jgi:hypothetical protein